MWCCHSQTVVYNEFMHLSLLLCCLNEMCILSRIGSISILILEIYYYYQKHFLIGLFQNRFLRICTHIHKNCMLLLSSSFGT